MTIFSAEITALISQLSLEEKVRLLSGEDAWTTFAIDRIGLRKMTLSDGPSGVRGPLWDERHKSLTLPSATCTSATWNLDHLYAVGVISANEARSKGVSVVLGPTINLHRSPRGGRHFEAYSEDPFLSGKLAASYVRGVQDNGVAATPKHYIANDSENDRMTVDVQVDEQTLHELYLAPFETAVREAKAWAIMASYNRINGTTATEHDLLENPLRSEWGFDGLAMSDWTAVRSVAESANASLDLAMPGADTPWSQGLVAAVQAGEVAESVIDQKVGHLLTLAKRVGALGDSTPKTPASIDSRKVIREVAADGFVLVEDRFAGRFMGMSEPVIDATKSVFARTNFTAKQTGAHRFGIAGIGYSKIRVNGEVVLDVFNPLETSDILEALLAAPERYIDVDLEAGQTVSLEYEYIKEFPFEFNAVGVLFGYRAPRLAPEVDLQLAVEAAKAADVAVVVVGTTAHVESEGYDRKSMALPGRQDELVRAVAAANPNTVVVINAGSPVEMPWRKDVAAVLLTWFPGEEYGNALADVIYGHREPGGRLPTTWGATLADAPVSNTDPIDGALPYAEGLNIGYRAWAKAGTAPAYHFGFGLGYTTWQLSDLATPAQIASGDAAHVEVTLTNTGDRDGADVVQVYLRRKSSSVRRPEFWLAGFVKANVAAGQSARVAIEVSGRQFAHFNNGWHTEAGDFEVIVARSAALENALSNTVTVQ